MTQSDTSGQCADLLVPVTSADHIEGSPTAAIMLVEYGDYECPYCLNARPVLRELRSELGDRFALTFRHFPQSSIHPHASAAAQAAEAAASQGKFWEMHDLLFEHQQDLGTIDLTHLALQLGLEVYRFEADLQNSVHLRRIRDDFLSGSRSGVKGTPTFFIQGCRYEGPVETAAMAAAIQHAAPSIG